MARIEGPNLILRLIEVSDAEYVHGLRTDPDLGRHLSPVHGGAEEQRAWIAAYKAREAAGQEFYYIIERRDGMRCGTVRLYGLEAERFTWGSWILDGSKPPKAALESAVLSFGIGFRHLNLPLAMVDVRAANVHAQAFYCRFGMTETHRDSEDIFFSYPRARFEADRSNFMNLLQEGHVS